MKNELLKLKKKTLLHFPSERGQQDCSFTTQLCISLFMKKMLVWCAAAYCQEKSCLNISYAPAHKELHLMVQKLGQPNFSVILILQIFFPLIVHIN